MTAYPDGRIVIAGADPSTVSRYTANGALDTTFNATGSVDVKTGSLPFPESVPNGIIYLNAVAVGENDSVYVGGWDYVSNDNSKRPYAFLKIPADGQGSTSGCSGYLGNATKSYIANLSLLSTGKFAGALAFVVVTGEGMGVGVGRYLHPQSSCDLDPNYGNNGIWYSADVTYVDDVFFETDGSGDLLVEKAGTSIYSLVHIEPAGQHTAQVDLPPDGSYNDITRVPDGRYLVAGQFQSAGDTSMTVAYYNSDLTPDMSIGPQGIVTIPISTTLIDPTGGTGLRAVYTPDAARTIVVGSIAGAIDTISGITHRFVVARIWN